MRALGLTKLARRRRLQILCIGAHCDDIDIGCGGTLLALLERNPGARVTWVVMGSTPVRARELRASARRFLRRAGKAQVLVHQFRDGFFPRSTPPSRKHSNRSSGCPTPTSSSAIIAPTCIRIIG